MRFYKHAISVISILVLSLSVKAQDGSKADGTLIVLNKSDANASIISLQDNATVTLLETGVAPHEAAVTPDGRMAVVSNYGNREAPGSTLTVLDLQAPKVIKTIDLEKYHRPHGLTFLLNGKRLLVTAEAEKMLLIVDVERGKVLNAIETGQEVSHMVALAEKAGLAFVANIRSGSVSVIDIEKTALIKVIETGAGAEGIDVSPDGREVWVSNRAADNLSIIDISTMEIIHTLACKSFPIRVKFTPNGKFVLVSNGRSGDVAVFDAEKRREIHRIPMELKATEKKQDRLFREFGDSPVPVGILIHPDGGFAYVANTNADIVTVIDLTSWEIANRIKTGREPDGLGFSGLNLVQTTKKP